jgi:hypothetical protein
MEDLDDTSLLGLLGGDLFPPCGGQSPAEIPTIPQQKGSLNEKDPFLLAGAGCASMLCLCVTSIAGIHTDFCMRPILSQVMSRRGIWQIGTGIP